MKSKKNTASNDKKLFIPLYRTYSQSEYRKAVVQSTVLGLFIVRCAYLALNVLATAFSMAITNALRCNTMNNISDESVVFSRYIHQSSAGKCVYQENTSDALDIPWYNSQKRWITNIIIYLVCVYYVISVEIPVFERILGQKGIH